MVSNMKKAIAKARLKQDEAQGNISSRWQYGGR